MDETSNVKQMILVELDAADSNQLNEYVALFNEDGTAFAGFTGDTGAQGPVGPTADLVTVATAIGTVAKTTTDAEPATGTIVPIQFTNGNTASSPTISFDNGPVRAIKLGGTATTGAKITLAADGIALFYFDGTTLHQLGVYS